MKPRTVVSVLVAVGLVAPVVPGLSHQTTAHAAATTTRAVYKLVDLNPVGVAGGNSTDLRIVRNEAFDSLVNATKIVSAVTDMAPGGEFDGSSGCALVESDLWCWGNNTFGRLGDGTTDASPVPKLVPSGVKDVFSSTLHTCAVKDNGDLVCAGGSTSYLSGFLTSFSPPIATNVQSINDGGWPCITKTDGRLFCAGNFRRSIGYSDRFVPTEWSWEDTGLLASGDVANGGIQPPFQGPGAVGNGWDNQRIVCAVNAGQVSCVVMDPHTRESSIPTFSVPTPMVGANNVTNLFVEIGPFGSSVGALYAYSDGLLYKSDKNLGAIASTPYVSGVFHVASLPTAFQAVGSMDQPLGLIATPRGTNSVGSGFVFQSGIGTLNFDPIAKFSDSTTDLSHTIVRVTAQTSVFQVIPMEVATDVRTSRTNARLRVMAGGNPVVGASVSWKSADLAGSAGESTQVPLTTDINGWIDLPTVATGPVTFEVTGGVSGVAYLAKSRTTVSIGSSGDINISLAAPPATVEHTLTVTSSNGQPVPSAVVTMVNLFRTNQTTATSTGSAAWSTSKPVEGYVYTPNCPQCFAPQVSLITGEDGKVTFSVYNTIQRWPVTDPVKTVGKWVPADFSVSYNDGVTNVSTFGILDGTTQSVQLQLEGGVSLAGARDVSATPAGASIAVTGTTTGVVTEEICDVMVTGGLWSDASRFDQRSCANGSIKKASVGTMPMANMRCARSQSRIAKNKVAVCPKRSMFLRLRVPGKAGTKGICVVVAKKPCVTKQSVRYGVPRILQTQKSVSLVTLASTRKGTKITATVPNTSRSLCQVKSGRLIAKKIAGECVVSISARTKNRMIVYNIPVLIAR